MAARPAPAARPRSSIELREARANGSASRRNAVSSGAAPRSLRSVGIWASAVRSSSAIVGRSSARKRGRRL